MSPNGLLYAVTLCGLASMLFAIYAVQSNNIYGLMGVWLSFLAACGFMLIFIMWKD